MAVVPVVIGAIIALLSVNSDPLAQFERLIASQIPRRESVEKQFLLATLEDTEDAWRKVVSYFPNDEALTPQNSHYVRTARQRLARLYLEQGRYSEAIPELTALTQLPDTERSMRAFGLAGLAVAHASRQDWDAATDAFTRFLSVRSALENEPADRFLREALLRVEREIRRRLATNPPD
jgi:hypothetical protein